MSERLDKKISELRNRVNESFTLNFRKCLIKENERGIVAIEEECLNEEAFTFQIANLASLIEDFDNDVLLSLIKEKPKEVKGLALLERFLNENKMDTKPLESFKTICRIRSTAFPIHRGTSRERALIMEKLDFAPPFDWDAIWKRCASIYRNGLAQLCDSINDHFSRLKYERIDEEHVHESKTDYDLIYLNDYLYKYRILLPLKDRTANGFLIDYLTGAIIAYERNLKSIDYAIRKYVIPMKGKFREHAEDPYFVKHRRYINNEILIMHKISIPRDDNGISKQEDFQRFWRYLWASIAAYRMDMSPDWIIKGYWGKSYLATGRTYQDELENVSK